MVNQLKDIFQEHLRKIEVQKQIQEKREQFKDSKGFSYFINEIDRFFHLAQEWTKLINNNKEGLRFERESEPYEFTIKYGNHKLHVARDMTHNNIELSALVISYSNSVGKDNYEPDFSEKRYSVAINNEGEESWKIDNEYYTSEELLNYWLEKFIKSFQ